MKKVVGMWLVVCAVMVFAAQVVRAEDKANEKTEKVTWLGAACTETSDETGAQLDLADGCGLTVRSVVADSPAEKAGLKENDVLTKLDDQILMDPSQLRTLIQMKKPGDKVKLTYFRKGKEAQLTAKLGETEDVEDVEDEDAIDLGDFKLDLSKILGNLSSVNGKDGSSMCKVITLGNGGGAIGGSGLEGILKGLAGDTNIANIIQQALKGVSQQGTNSVAGVTPIVKVITLGGNGSSVNSDEISKAINDALKGISSDTNVVQTIQKAVEQATKQATEEKK